MLERQITISTNNSRLLLWAPSPRVPIHTLLVLLLPRIIYRQCKLWHAPAPGALTAFDHHRKVRKLTRPGLSGGPSHRVAGRADPQPPGVPQPEGSGAPGGRGGPRAGAGAPPPPQPTPPPLAAPIKRDLRLLSARKLVDSARGRVAAAAAPFLCTAPCCATAAEPFACAGPCRACGPSPLTPS